MSQETKKNRIYVPLLVSNYLHLSNARQKLEVKLFKGNVPPLFLFYICLFHFIIRACRWHVDGSVANSRGYEHYLCIYQPVHDTHTIFLIRLKMSHTRKRKCSKHHHQQWLDESENRMQQSPTTYSRSENRIKFKWMVSVARAKHFTKSPNTMVTMITNGREKNKRTDEHTKSKPKTSINTEKIEKRRCTMEIVNGKR